MKQSNYPIYLYYIELEQFDSKLTVNKYLLLAKDSKFKLLYFIYSIYRTAVSSWPIQI